MLRPGRCGLPVSDERWVELADLVQDYDIITQRVDRFRASIKFLVSGVIFGTVPILCCTLYLMLHFKSAPEIRIVAADGTLAGLTLWFSTFICASALNHKVSC